MQEMITIRKEELEDLKKQLLASVELLEEIEFQEGVKRGREQFKLGKSISLDDYKKKHKK